HKAPEKVSNIIQDLVEQGQIDTDEYGMPDIRRYERARSIHTVYFIRGGKPAYIIINTLSKKEPIKSWKDGEVVRNTKKRERRMRELPNDDEE
ncbi:MAG: hypothetical protein D6698_02240, partial [Gammaproteobacteria bacterium]